MSQINSSELIKLDKVCFDYEPNKLILDNLSFSIKKGQFVAIVGSNGSGKSTLAKLMSCLLKPRSGSIYFDNVLLDKTSVLNIKKRVGIVFENPDTQFIGQTVEDDIAFGLENKCVNHSEMFKIIEHWAKVVGISDLLKSAPNSLSGGQKQLAAIAAILALEPNVIIFDEVTSMLDNKSKANVQKVIKSLQTKFNKTIILITHDMDEAALADNIIVLSEGKVALCGKPNDVFQNEKLNTLSLDKPFIYKVVDKLGKDFVRKVGYEKDSN